MDDDNLYALKVALLCALAYAFPVAMATYVDANIHHVLWGVRNYWMGYWVVLGFIFPFFFAYIFNRNDSDTSFLPKKFRQKFSEISGTARRRSLLTFLSVFIPIILVLLLNFGPEYPHWAIFYDSFGYALVIAAMVYVHNHKFDYINSESMSEHAQIERIKSEHKTWLYTTIGLTVAFILFCLLMYVAFQFLPSYYTNNPSEQVLLFNSFLADLFLGIVLAIFPLSELHQKVQYIQNLIREAKENRVDLKPEVFIGHAREDYEAAHRLWEDLKKAGIDAWLDKKSLMGGHRWKYEIEKAIHDSRFFVAVLSKSMRYKRGYIQVEIKEALDVLDEFPEYQIYIIPIRLDECDPNNELNELHWVDMFPSWEMGMNEILRTIFSSNPSFENARMKASEVGETE